MQKRRKPTPPVLHQEGAALAKARLNPSREQAPPAAAEAAIGPDHERFAGKALVAKAPAGGPAHNGQEEYDRSRNDPPRNGHALNGAHKNGAHKNGAYRNGHDRGGEAGNGHCHDKAGDEVRTLIRGHRLDAANRVVMTLLDQRIAAGDGELYAAAMLLQHYYVVLSRQPPLSHVGTLPLRPNDRLYACFDQFIDLIRQQQSQVSELQAIIAELL